MAKKVRIASTPEEDAVLDTVGDLAALGPAADEMVSAAELDADVGGPDSDLVTADQPAMCDPEWPEYVMRQFAESELDPDGRPFVHGLRRVVRQLLGPIYVSRAHVVQAPQFIGTELKLQPVTVEHTVEILMLKVDHRNLSAYKVEFTEAADVYWGNTDAEVARHPTATASTRAEARALRKALGLDQRIAAEETTRVPLAESAIDGCITPSQIKFLDVLCSKNDINVQKYVNSGKKRYDLIEEVPFGVAAKMVEHLSGLQNDRSQISDAIRGYEKWSK